MPLNWLARTQIGCAISKPGVSRWLPVVNSGRAWVWQRGILSKTNTHRIRNFHLESSALANVSTNFCENTSEQLEQRAQPQAAVWFMITPGSALFYSCHMRFYFWKEAALIKRCNCLSACLMPQLLHLLQAWISLLLQFSRFPCISRWVLN